MGCIRNRVEILVGIPEGLGYLSSLSRSRECQSILGNSRRTGGSRLPAIGALIFAIAEYAFATVVRITLSLSSVIAVIGGIVVGGITVGGIMVGIMINLNFEFKIIFNYTSVDLMSHTQNEGAWYTKTRNWKARSPWNSQCRWGGSWRGWASSSLCVVFAADLWAPKESLFVQHLKLWP